MPAKPEPPAEYEAAPVGEHIHMPGPSILPIFNCASIVLILLGITEGMLLLVSGLVMFAVTTGIWIVKVREEWSHLPDSSH